MNNNHISLYTSVTKAALQQLKENWGWYLTLGILLTILGTLAVIFAVASTLISVVYLGALLIVAGIFEGIKASKIHHWSTFFLHLFLSVLYIVGGIFIVLNPEVNAISLTLLLAFFFIVSGMLKIIFACAKNLPHRFWLLFNGIITALLGFLILQQWPSSGLWVLGMFVGIEMIFSGWSWIMLALAAKNMKIEHSA